MISAKAQSNFHVRTLTAPVSVDTVFGIPEGKLFLIQPGKGETTEEQMSSGQLINFYCSSYRGIANYKRKNRLFEAIICHRVLGVISQVVPIHDFIYDLLWKD